MAKARRGIEQKLSLCDAAVVILDARIPYSSSDPTLPELLSGKPCIYIFNKSSLADREVTSAWLEYYSGRGLCAVDMDCMTGRGLHAFKPAAQKLLADRISRNTERGMAGRELSFMVLGVPNTGKSTFINKMTGKRSAKTEDRAGVTRDISWFSGDGFRFMDTPGVLWPKFEDPRVGPDLAAAGCIRDDILDTEDVAARLLSRLAVKYPAALAARYKVDVSSLTDGASILELIGRRRGMLVRGGGVDTLRAAATVLDEFRGGRLGPMSLEAPDD